MQFAQTVLQDLGESQEDREIDAADLQPVDELLEVDGLRRVLVGMDHEVSLGPDGEIAVPPAGDLVQVGRVGGAPRFDVEIDGHGNSSSAKCSDAMPRSQTVPRGRHGPA